MDFEIWIASHIDCEERLIYLSELIKSISQYSVFISISSNVSSFYLEEYKNVIVLKQDKELKQFEHIKKILQYRNNIDENKTILFMDDDDSSVPKFEIIIKNMKNGLSLQIRNMDPKEKHLITELWLMNETNLFTFDQIENVKNGTLEEYTKDTRFSLRSDFSGTFCQFKYIKEYLSLYELDNIYKLEINQITDRQFVEYLKRNYIKHVDKPIVLGRKWCDNSYWVSTLKGFDNKGIKK